MATASYVSMDSPPPFASQFVEVEVDTETGQITVTKMVMAVDAGVPINPITASGQVEGGMTQALGYGHCEEMAFDDQGQLLNPALGDIKGILRTDIFKLPESFILFLCLCVLVAELLQWIKLLRKEEMRK